MSKFNTVAVIIMLTACGKEQAVSSSSLPTPSLTPIPTSSPTPVASVIPIQPEASPSPKPTLQPVADKNLPTKAIPLLPVLNKAIDELWPSMQMRSYLPAQIEQESCISLTHSKCWDTRAELKTSREQGVGLGQFTRAWDASGKLRFDVVAELTKQYPNELKGWSWANVYAPELQIKAIVLKNRFNWNTLTFPVVDLENKMAFLAVTYNGGSTFKDRILCKNQPDCDPTRWFNVKNGKKGVEAYSVKSKIPVKGYKKSFFQISREYPVLVLYTRRPKYIPHMGD